MPRPLLRVTFLRYRFYYAFRRTRGKTTNGRQRGTTKVPHMTSKHAHAVSPVRAEGSRGCMTIKQHVPSMFELLVVTMSLPFGRHFTDIGCIRRVGIIMVCNASDAISVSNAPLLLPPRDSFREGRHGVYMYGCRHPRHPGRGI